jgi:hypothetical protein
MRSSKFVSSRLYAIYIAADEIFKIGAGRLYAIHIAADKIFKIGIVPALRDLYRRRRNL